MILYQIHPPVIYIRTWKSSFHCQWVHPSPQVKLICSKMQFLEGKPRKRGDLIGYLCNLTYDDLAGFYCLGDLVGWTHLRVADSSENKDDEAWPGPPIVLWTGFVLLSGTGRGRWWTKAILKRFYRKSFMSKFWQETAKSSSWQERQGKGER